MRAGAVALPAALLALAGCLGPAPLPESTAAGVVDAAFEELSSTWHGNGTSVRMATLNQTGWKGDRLESQMTLQFEWGTGEAERTQVRQPPTGKQEGLDLELYCFPDREFLVAPNGTFEARRGTAWCPIVTGRDEPDLGQRPGSRHEGLNAMLEFRRDGRPVTVDAQGNAHATVRAVWPEEDRSDEVQFLEATVSPSGRILELTDAEGSERLSWVIEYGPRRTFERPGPVADRASTSLGLYEALREADDTLTLQVNGRDLEATPPVPASDLSLRLLRDGTEVARVPLGASSAGYTARHVDRDGDGLVSIGDQVQVDGPQAGSLTAVLHDDWAGHDARYMPYKLPEPWWMAPLALAAVALLARRR